MKVRLTATGTRPLIMHNVRLASPLNPFAKKLKELNAKFTKGFSLGKLDLTGYLDVRNLLNFKNVLQVFAVNGDVRNNDERAANLKADLDDLASERDINNAVGPDGSEFKARRASSIPEFDPAQWSDRY